MSRITPDQHYPTRNHLLIKIAEKTQETESGLITADTATNSAPVVGEVIRKGDQALFKVGEIVMFRRYSVDEIRVPTETGEDDIFYFIEDTDVLSVIKVEPLPEENKYEQIRERKTLTAEKKHADEKTAKAEDGVNKDRISGEKES